MHNCPAEELHRSPAAQVVTRLAAASGLFLRHFEHRHHLTFPPQWIPRDRPDLSGETLWKNGELKEHKFLHFRYDQPLGSFHPSHRAKWTTHELCHGLVGFAWRPDMTPFAHLLVARLAELLPVALWYFFDEVQLRRCQPHYLQGALFQEHCVYCEDLARQGPRLPEAEDELFRRDGLKFIRDELAMISRSKRFGRPLPHRFATLDLNSDGMAYVAQQRLRMEDPVFRLFTELFHGPHTGMWADLEELEGRVWGLSEALSGGLPANPLSAGREHWIAQDIGWRLLALSAHCEDPEAIDRLRTLAEDLSRSPAELAPILQGYQELHEAFFIPEVDEFFAVGYPLSIEGSDQVFGSDYVQLYRGVDDACPSLAKALGEEGLSEQIEAFASWDLERPQRLPIGRRFSQFLKETAEGPLAELAMYEAAIQHPDPPDPWAASLGWSFPEDELVRRSQGVEVLHLQLEISQMIEALEQGDVNQEISERPHHLLISNLPGGVRHLAEISEQSANALELLREGPLERSLLNLSDEDWDILVDASAITPCSWHIYQPEEDLSQLIQREGPLPDAMSFTATQSVWRQSRPVERPHTDSDRDFALEPTSRGHTAPVPEALEESSEETAIRSLEALTSTIEELRTGLASHADQFNQLKHRGARGRGWSQSDLVGQRSTFEALQEIGYREDRPPATAFEVQLREALSKEREQKSQEPEEDFLENMDDLFTFNHLSEQVSEALKSRLVHEDFTPPDHVELDADWMPHNHGLDVELIQTNEEDEVNAWLNSIEPSSEQFFEEPPPASDVSIEDHDDGIDVGFGERWSDWDNES